MTGTYSSFFETNVLKKIALLTSGLVVALSLPLLASSAHAAAITTPVVTSGLSEPYQVAFDSSGNMFIAGGNSYTIQEVSAAALAGPGPASAVNVTSTFSADRPVAVAFDQSGNLFIGGQFTGNVYEITAAQLAGPAPYTPTLRLTVGSDLNGMSFDNSGDLFIAGASGTIYEVAAAQLLAATPTVTQAVATGVSGLGSVAFDASGDLFISSIGGGVYEVFANQLGGSTVNSVQTIVTVADAPSTWGLAVDSAGDLFAAHSSTGVIEVTAAQLGSGAAPFTPTTVAAPSVFGEPIGLTFGPNGDLYVGDFGDSTIDAISGLTVASPVPPAVLGLSANETTGSITGKWTGSASATTYTCTLMFAFNDPSLFTATTTSTTCSFSVNAATAWGISVTANNAAGSSGAVVAFGAAVVSPPLKKVTSIACTNGRHSKRFYGAPPKCPRGWWKK